MVAYCTLRADQTKPSPSELRRLVAETTAEHMAPKLIHFVDTIPRLPNYKPDLVRLAAMASGPGMPITEKPDVQSC